MKFRKFFKENDSLKVSLVEDRHYMKHSTIPSDTFPAPLSVMNILNAVGGAHLQIKVFGWIFTEGIKNAAVDRKDFAKKWSEQLGVNIPQEAIFSEEAMKQIPQLAENIEQIEEEWMLQFEPKQINIPITSSNVQHMNVIPLAQINAVLKRQGKTPLYFGRRDGLLEYIENGHWRSEQIGSPAITPFDKKGISLAVDEDSDGTFIMPNGERVISLGESPEKIQRKPMTYDEMKDKYGLELVWDEEEEKEVFKSSKEFDVKVTGDRKLAITAPGSDPEVFNINFKGDVESSLFTPAASSEFFGSYVAPPFFNKISYWSQKLKLAKNKSARVARQVIEDVVKSGKSFAELDDSDLSEEEFDYLRQLIDNGEISPESFESRKMTLKDLSGLVGRGLKGTKSSQFQKVNGTAEDGGPTDEEWLQYKAAAKAGIVARLMKEPTKPSGDENDVAQAWGGDTWRPKIAVSDKRGVVDLTDENWRKLPVEKIADELLSMIFDDETKSAATQLNITWPNNWKPNAEVNVGPKGYQRKKATKPIVQFFSDIESIKNYPGSAIEIQGEMEPIKTQDVAASMKSIGGDVFKMPGVEFQTVVPISKTEIDSSKFRDWIPFFNMEVPDPNSKEGKTKTVTKRADSIDDIPDSVTMAMLQHAGSKKQIVRIGPDAPWQEVRPRKETSFSEKEIQSYIQDSGYEPAWLDKKTLQLHNPENGDELLFHTKLQKGERRYFSVPPAKSTTVEDPYVHGLNVTVNTQDYHRRRIAGSSEQQKQDFEYYKNHPEEFGTTKWEKYPPEVVSASQDSYVTQADQTKKSPQILDEFGSSGVFYLANLIHNIKFRYGDLEHLSKNLLDKGISGNDNYTKILQFVKKWLFNGQKYAKEMTDSNSLSEMVRLDDGTPVCGIDQNGDAVFATPVYEALLQNGRNWRTAKAGSGMRKAIQDDLKTGGALTRGTGGSSGEDEYDPISDVEDDSVGWGSNEDDEDYDDPSQFYGDDELDDEEGVKRGNHYDSEDDLSGFSIAGAGYDSEPEPELKPDDEWEQSQRKRLDLRGARIGTKSQTTQIQPNVPTAISGGQPYLGSMSGLRSFQPEQPKPKKPTPQQPATPQQKYGDFFDSPAQPKPKPKPKKKYEDFFDHFLSFSQWEKLHETGPYDPKVAKKKYRTFNVWGAPPQGKVPQKSIDGEADTADKDPDGSKGVKSGRK